MAEAEIMGEEWKSTRDYYAEQLRKEGNENIADIIETTTPQKLAKEDFIDGLVIAAPEYEDELKSLREEVLELQESGDEAYDWTKYFEYPSRESNKNFQKERLVEDIEQAYSFRKIRDSEEVYVYKNGYYQPKGQQIIEEECEKRLGPEFTINRVREVKNKIEVRSYIKRRKFRPPQRKINLQNGVYDLEKEELIDHSPDFYFKQKIPVRYNPDAECPNIHDFLSDIVESEKEVKTLREIIGYCLLPDYPIAKAFMLVGKGNNGKSRYLDLLREIVGEENAEEKGLQELEDSRFGTHWLSNKLACIDDDLSSNKLRETSTMKKLTGGSKIGAEVKYGGQYSFKNYSKLVFACNELPQTTDDSDGFYRRWILVEFPYKFKEKPDPGNELEKKGMPKKELNQKIMQQQELEGLLWWSIEALKDVLNNNEFTYAPTTDKARQKWREYSVPMVKFIEKYIEQGTTYKEAENIAEDGSEVTDYFYDYIRKDFLKQVIGDFCEARNHSRPSTKAITQELKKFDLYVNPKAQTRQEPEDRKVPVYGGIKMNYPDPEGCQGVDTYSSSIARVGAQVESSKQSVDALTRESPNRILSKVEKAVEEADENVKTHEIAEKLSIPEDRAWDVLNEYDEFMEVKPNEWMM